MSEHDEVEAMVGYTGAADHDQDEHDDSSDSTGSTDSTDSDSVDSELDRALDDVDDGDAQVRELPPVSGELPLVLAVRERFASLSDVALTGDARVDAATARLQEIPDLPTSDHVAVYDDVHRRLQDALSDADTH
jgi:hypothetical protein